ncbi:MAG: hypothetical protein ABFS16_14020 [Bacteroidota bacterium]
MNRNKLIPGIMLVLGMLISTYNCNAVAPILVFDMGDDIYVICDDVQEYDGGYTAEDGCVTIIGTPGSTPAEVQQTGQTPTSATWVVYGSEVSTSGGDNPSDPDGDGGTQDDPPDQHCPCCGSKQHTNCECENCSTQYSNLGCIRAVERIYEVNNFASLSWHLAVAGLYIALNIEGLPGMSDLTQGMNPDDYNFRVDVDYLKGSLYQWSGKCHYECSQLKITKIENANNTFINRGILGGESGTFTFTRIDKSTGESIQLFEIIGLQVNEDVILFSEIDRDGFPKVGETLEKPFIVSNY